MALTIADLFEHAVDLCGDHKALVCGDDSLTYAEVLRAAVVNVNYRCVAEEQNSDAVAVVCEHLRRRWICIELDEASCATGVKRIEAERKQLKLF